jgi:hypothetical protein
MKRGPKPGTRLCGDPLTRYVVDDAGCWMWQGSVTGKGYGNVRVAGKTKYAHRFFYEHHVGPIPAGLDLDHLCRVQTCVNPEHLEPVTHRENVLRGEGPSAQQARLTHCKRGHELSGDNVYSYRGKRECRECRRVTFRAWRERRKAA